MEKRSSCTIVRKWAHQSPYGRPLSGSPGPGPPGRVEPQGTVTEDRMLEAAAANDGCFGVERPSLPKQATNLRVPIPLRDDRTQWQNPCDTKRLLSRLLTRATNLGDHEKKPEARISRTFTAKGRRPRPAGPGPDSDSESGKL